MPAKQAPSVGEEMFAMHCRAENLPLPEREHKFCATRKWRFDFAWPQYKVAAEVEGGTGTGGRHTRRDGYEKDCEKYNVATIEGWRVYRFTTQMVKTGKAIDQMRDVFAKANA